MAKRKKDWPPWWEWELELTDYTYKRLTCYERKYAFACFGEHRADEE